jgi:aldehyde:ferredoxin oxidoreductase
MKGSLAKNTVGGYAGKLLRVDLTNSGLSEESIEQSELRKYVGGAGIGAKYLYEEVAPGIDSFDAENRLIIATGPLSATRIPGGGTFSVSTKGCLTNGATSSQANGFFGAFMKLAGFDGIIINGIAPKLSYLYIHDGISELRDAGHLIGKDAFETEDIIRRDLGCTRRNMSVATIGPAGENLVKFAAINADKGHVAGHNGTGAIMGRKKLKAIAVVRGSLMAPPADPKRVSELAKEILRYIKNRRGLTNLYEYGTLGTYTRVESIGALPIKNYTTNIYPDKNKLHQFTPEYIRGRFQPRRDPCWACHMHHCHESTITEGPYSGMVVQEPEFECLSAMGSQIGNMEVASAMMLTDVVDRLGLEINETGWLIGLVMECYEKRIITEKDTGGIEMTWGNVEATKALLEKIVARDGFGDVLAEGTMRAAQKIGGEAPNFAIHTMKGNTPRGYDHRGFWTEYFDKITSNIGTIESRPFPMVRAGVPKPEDIVAIAASGKWRMSFEDTLGTCRFATLAEPHVLVEAVKAVTGWEFSEKEAENVGLRILNLFRAFNYRHGHSRELETPSPRYGSTPVDGPAAGKSILPVLDGMLDDYYRRMGWDEKTGKPLPQTLEKLGLGHVITDIWHTRG